MIPHYGPRTAVRHADCGVGLGWDRNPHAAPRERYWGMRAEAVLQHGLHQPYHAVEGGVAGGIEVAAGEGRMVGRIAVGAEDRYRGQCAAVDRGLGAGGDHEGRDPFPYHLAAPGHLEDAPRCALAD